MSLRGVMAGLAIAGAVWAATGCSSMNAAPPETLVGRWVRVNGTANDLGLTFNSDGTYEAHFLQTSGVAPGATIWDQMSTGTYEATDTQLTLTPLQSTCGGTTTIIVEAYQVSGDELSLTTTAATTESVSLTWDGGPPINQGATLGCMRSEDSFTASPLLPVTITSG